MTALVTVSDFQSLATAVADLLPNTSPLTATLEAIAPDPTTFDLEFEVATLQFVGASQTLLLLAISPETMAPLAASGLDLGAASGPQVLLDSIAEMIGDGVITGRAVSPQTFALPSTVFFSLRSGASLHGWFALNIQEVDPVFDQDRNLENPGAATTTSAAFGATTLAADPMGATPGAAKSMRMLYDVEMTLTAEIGRAKLPVRQILDLTPGAIVELDRVAGSPADLMVNGHLVARGEVVVVDEDYGLRITEIMDATEGLV